MKVSTFEARTKAEALAQARGDLGPGVIILGSRKIRRGGLLGFLGADKLWQVMASEDGQEGVSTGRYEPSDSSGLASGKTVLAVAALESATRNRGITQPEDKLANEIAELKHDISILITRQKEVSPAGGYPALDKARSDLLEKGVDSNVVKSILDKLSEDLSWTQLQNDDELGLQVQQAISSNIHTVNGNPPLKRQNPPARVIALVGPTGVGKTTTIAKLASDFKLRQGLSVGLITMDTYRIAAVDQLRTYAEILNVELRTVLTPGEMSSAVHAMRDLDVVLIDTVGRSQHSVERLGQLRSFIEAAEPSETHLVVSATASANCAKEVIDSFSLLGVNHVILSKLDEAASFALAVNMTAYCANPLSYVTTGQDVPNDCMKAEAESLAEWIVSGLPGGESE